MQHPFNRSPVRKSLFPEASRTCTHTFQFLGRELSKKFRADKPHVENGLHSLILQIYFGFVRCCRRMEMDVVLLFVREESNPSRSFHPSPEPCGGRNEGVVGLQDENGAAEVLEGQEAGLEEGSEPGGHHCSGAC
mmetsp:Transcript_19157/g.31551  ORF Transcript_19157/g.31551 Transcript_19157/m.31551 type:complete len:135 (-) Transcript_19157:1362-1766(-)